MSSHAVSMQVQRAAPASKWRVLLAAAASLTLLATACSNDDSLSSSAASTSEHSTPSESTDHQPGDVMHMGVAVPPAWEDGVIAAPTRHTGPQGGAGQFVAKCLYSHSDTDDPIVYPGEPDLSHLHDFYGSVDTDEFSTTESLTGTETTCNKPGDSAAYWQPALFSGDEKVTPLSIAAYYRAAPGIDPTDVVPFPEGLAMITGDALATAPQEGEASGWACGVRTTLLKDPPDCSSNAPLHMVLTFQDCWDGKNIDSPEHRDHVTYSRDGACPSTHPVSIPQLTMSINFGLSAPYGDLRLASGNLYSAHGDFLNTWVQEKLEREITACIHRDVVCDLASNREEDGPFFTA